MPWDIYVVTDSEQSLGRTHLDVVSQAVRAGVDAVLLRDNTMSKHQLVELGLVLREITLNAGVTLVVSNHVSVAQAIDADGVHLGKHDLTVSQARNLLGYRKIIGICVNSIEEARQAEDDGADYVAVGTMYATPCESEFARAVGPSAVATIKSAISIPVLAMGGITPANVGEVMRAGADGVAITRAIVHSWDIPEAVRSLRYAIEAAFSAEFAYQFPADSAPDSAPDSE